MTDLERYRELVTVMEADIPGFAVRFKTDSKLQWLISRLMFWMNFTDPDTGIRHYPYMETFTTTMGSTIWFPTAEYVERRAPWQTLEHEWVHLKDSSTLFGWLPWMPRIVNRALFGLLYIIPPIPAPGRAYIEVRAYRRTLELIDPDDRQVATDNITKQFTGAGYFWMWPFPAAVKRWLDQPSPYRDMMDNYSEGTSAAED